MRIVEKIRTLGIGFVFERAFETIVPAWMFRCNAVAVYQLDFDKFSGDQLSAAAIKICDSEHELEQLREIARVDSATGVLATMDGEPVGGLCIALNDFEDSDVGLSFLLGDQGAWIYAARVDEEYRRRGIYSHLMAQSVEARKNMGLAAPFIGVTLLNKGSHKAIKRFGTHVGNVFVIRVGSMAWARSTGDLKQKQNWTLQCTRRPIQLEVPYKAV